MGGSSGLGSSIFKDLELGNMFHDIQETMLKEGEDKEASFIDI